MDLNQDNAMELIGVYMKLMALERSGGATTRNLNAYERNIEATLRSIPWSFGSAGEEASKGTLLGRVDQMAAELRDDEVLLLASGRPVPNLIDNFPIEFPQPRNNKMSAFNTKTGLE
jgi:hypothetical protein